MVKNESMYIFQCDIRLCMEDLTKETLGVAPYVQNSKNFSGEIYRVIFHVPEY